MDAHIPLLIIDRKEPRVMSAHYRTSRVTRLRIINLLSTRKVGSMIELHRKSFKKIKKKSEKKNWKCFGSFLKAPWVAYLDRPEWGQPHGLGRSQSVAPHFD
jgi:hypothetical protein